MIRHTFLRAAGVLVALAAVAGPALTATPAAADEARASALLNAPLSSVQDSNKSWKTILQTAVAMSAPPTPVGAEFNGLTIWPGMADWDKVKEWAGANSDMAKAILTTQDGPSKAFIFGMPYGRAAIPPELVEKGVYISIGDGPNQFLTNPAYLHVLDTVQAYVVAEMYRLGQEQKFDEALRLGLNTLRLWRQVADQQLLDEKKWALERICDMCSVQRDFMYTFLEQIPAPVLRRMSMDGYPFVRASDGERMMRLQMPEGDRLVAEVALESMFDAQGQADEAKFAAVLSPLQAKEEPLTYFGAVRRWEKMAEVHGSYDATKAKITSIYDDWWRRWRVRYFDPLLDNPTAISRTNHVRYALVVLLAKDMESLFTLRMRTNAELNGTVLACGLCAWHRDLGTWPRSLDQAYAQFVRKRFDYDPFNPKYGRWHYQLLTTPKVVESGEFGRLELKNALLYALGLDKQDSGGMAASLDGLSGDFIAWPPLRAVAREQGAQP